MKHTAMAFISVAFFVGCGESDAESSEATTRPGAASRASAPVHPAQADTDVDALLGESAGLLPWEDGRDVLGESRATLRERHGTQHDSDSPHSEETLPLRLPSGTGARVFLYEYTEVWPPALLTRRLDGDDTLQRPEDDVDYQIVRSYDVLADVDEATHRGVRAKLVSFYGEPRAFFDVGARAEAFYDAERQRRIILWGSGDALLTVERYTPLAALFPSEGHFGLDGESWLGSQPRAFVEYGTRQGWSCSDRRCSLPPTETAHRMNLELFVDEEQTGFTLEIRTVAPTEDVMSAFEDELVRAIETSFGAATPDGDPGRRMTLRHTFANGASLLERRSSQGSNWELRHSQPRG